MSHLGNDELQQNLFEASEDEKFQYVEQRKLKMIEDMWEHHFYGLPVIELIILAKQQIIDKHCLNTADEIVDKYNEIFQKGEK